MNHKSYLCHRRVFITHNCSFLFTDKEILSVKEHQEREIEAQKATIQEQKAQIEILRNVQANQIRMLEEVRQSGVEMSGTVLSLS